MGRGKRAAGKKAAVWFRLFITGLCIYGSCPGGFLGRNTNVGKALDLIQEPLAGGRLAKKPGCTHPFYTPQKVGGYTIIVKKCGKKQPHS